MMMLVDVFALLCSAAYAAQPAAAAPVWLPVSAPPASIALPVLSALPTLLIPFAPQPTAKMQNTTISATNFLHNFFFTSSVLPVVSKV